jgi:O-antigen ligase
MLPRSWDGGVYGHAHSDIAQLMYEAGWLPVVIVMAYIGLCLWRLIRDTLTESQVCAASAVLGLSVFSAIGFPWHVAQGAAAGLLVVANYEGELDAQA